MPCYAAHPVVAVVCAHELVWLDDRGLEELELGGRSHTDLVQSSLVREDRNVSVDATACETKLD